MYPHYEAAILKPEGKRKHCLIMGYFILGYFSAHPKGMNICKPMYHLNVKSPRTVLSVLTVEMRD
jgi:hypothetical protein